MRDTLSRTFYNLGADTLEKRSVPGHVTYLRALTTQRCLVTVLLKPRAKNVHIRIRLTYTWYILYIYLHFHFPAQLVVDFAVSDLLG